MNRFYTSPFSFSLPKIKECLRSAALFGYYVFSFPLLLLRLLAQQKILRVPKALLNIRVFRL